MWRGVQFHSPVVKGGFTKKKNSSTAFFYWLFSSVFFNCRTLAWKLTISYAINRTKQSKFARDYAASCESSRRGGGLCMQEFFLGDKIINVICIIVFLLI